MDKNAIIRRDLEVLKKLKKINKQNTGIKKRKRTYKIFLTINLFVIVFFLIPLFVFLINRNELASQADNSFKTDCQLLTDTSLNVSKPIELKKETVTESRNNNSPFVSDTFINIHKGVNTNLVSQKSSPLIKETVQDILDIYIAKTVVCREVNERNPIGEQYIFSLKENRYSVVWTEVKSKTIPLEIKHIYYLNDKKYCEVPLLVNYPRTRTWSRIMLKNHYQIGSWKVDIVSKDGKTLKQIEFEVKS
jgi:hypothetical protein